MNLYTPVPVEQVLQGEAPEPNYLEVLLENEGARLILQPVDSQTARVVRLIATNPQLYLKAEYCPGAVWELQSQPLS